VPQWSAQQVPRVLHVPRRWHVTAPALQRESPYRKFWCAVACPVFRVPCSDGTACVARRTPRWAAAAPPPATPRRWSAPMAPFVASRTCLHSLHPLDTWYGRPRTPTVLEVGTVSRFTIRSMEFGALRTASGAGLHDFPLCIREYAYCQMSPIASTDTAVDAAADKATVAPAGATRTLVPCPPGDWCPIGRSMYDNVTCPAALVG
jgi:hypothetical protein